MQMIFIPFLWIRMMDIYMIFSYLYFSYKNISYMYIYSSKPFLLYVCLYIKYKLI